MSAELRIPPMTMDERIEVVAPLFYPLIRVVPEAMPSTWDNATDDAKDICRRLARQFLTAAFPELSGDKPTHWLAPMEVTKEMVVAGEDALDDFKDSDWGSGPDGSTHSYEFFRSGHCKGMFEAMRDAYRGEGDGG